MPLATQTRRVGRPTRSQHSADNWRDDAVALLHERQDDARRMRKVIPFLEFGRVAEDGPNRDTALGIVQLEVERIARRDPDGAA